MSRLHGVPLDPRRRNPNRPYARKSRPYPTVTGVLDIMAIGGLAWSAANETALFAIHHPEEWQHLDTDAAYDRLRKHHQIGWSQSRDIGTALHAVNEAWSWGEDVDIPPELDGYVDGLEKCWNDYDLADTILATEEVVRHPIGSNSYIGQRDMTALINGERWLFDIKTTKHLEGHRYPDSWRLQLAAYAHAEEIVLYDENGKEEGTAPNYPVKRCGVIHLRGDGEYELLEVDASVSVHTRFLQARCVWTWMNKESKTPPLVVVPPPVREEVPA